MAQHCSMRDFRLQGVMRLDVLKQRWIQVRKTKKKLQREQRMLLLEEKQLESNLHFENSCITAPHERDYFDKVLEGLLEAFARDVLQQGNLKNFGPHLTLKYSGGTGY
eukprot:2805220-Amphidinium_carterae.1